VGIAEVGTVPALEFNLYPENPMSLSSSPLLIIAMPSFLLVACSDKDDPDDGDDTGQATECTKEARASYQLTLLDEDGSGITDASVAFSVEDRGEASCEGWEEGEWVCGWEVEGSLHITIDADGYSSEEFDVVVTADECHVETVIETRTLESVECTEEYVHAIVVETVDASGGAVEDTDVAWGYPDADMEPIVCDWMGGNLYGCASEESGDLEVFANSPIHGSAYQSFVVEHDGCHPVQQSWTAVLGESTSTDPGDE
jgi:hypothetical protein